MRRRGGIRANEEVGLCRGCSLWHIVKEAVGGEHDEVAALDGHAHQRRVVRRLEAGVGLAGLHVWGAAQLEGRVEGSELLRGAEGDVIGGARPRRAGGACAAHGVERATWLGEAAAGVGRSADDEEA